MKKPKRLKKWLAAAALAPVGLFLVLAILVYIPPVQQFVVNRVAESLSESMGMRIAVKEVRLAFPLDLAVHRVTAVEQSDTLLAARSLRLNVALMPLLKGCAEINGLSLYDVKLNTKSYVSDTRIQGTAGELTLTPSKVDWKNERVKLDRIRLDRADFNVALSDTAMPDTSTVPVRWDIAVAQADIEHSRIRLSLPGDSMRIGADIGSLSLRGGRFDIGHNYYALRSLKIQSSGLTYDLPLQKPQSGLDPNHLAISDLSLLLDTLSYDRTGRLRAALRTATLREKCGLQVNKLKAQIDMDTMRLNLPYLEIHTPYSRIQGQTAFDFSSFEVGKGGHLQAHIEARLGGEDIQILGKGFVDEAMLHVWPRKDLILQAEADGNIENLQLKKAELAMPGVFNLTANGHAAYLTENWRSGNFKVQLQTRNLAPVRKLLPSDLLRTVNVPDGVSLRGIVGFKSSDYQADLRLVSGKGTLTARAKVNLDRSAYRLEAQANQLQLAAFLPGMPLTPFTGKLTASGSNFDVLSSQARLHAQAQIAALSYEHYDLGGLSAQIDLQRGNGRLDISSNNPQYQFEGHADIQIDQHGYGLQLATQVQSVDLKTLCITKDTLYVGTKLEVNLKADKQFTAYNIDGSLRQNHFSSPQMSTMAKDICFDFATSTDTTTANLSAGDLKVSLGSKGNVPLLAKQLTTFATEFSEQASRRELNQERLKELLPVMDLTLKAGRANPLYNIARLKGYAFSSALLDLHTDPLIGMAGDVRVGSLQAGGLLLDTINTHILQDSTGVQLFGLVKNNRKNPTPLEVKLKGYMLKAGAGLELIYYDSQGEKGVDLGLQAELTEGGAYVHLYPERPVLAYRNFKVNKNNYIFLGKDKSIRADMDLLADDGTGVKIYGEPRDSLNDVTVSVNQVNLSELSRVLPYMPKLGGMFSGDVHITASSDYKNLSAVASVEANGFKYEGIPLGNLGVEALYLPKTGGEHHASAFISSNGEEVLACNGTYFDRDGGSFDGEANLHDFPLQLLNGFMAGTDVALKGIAAGDLKLKGSTDKPIINGTLDLDSAHIYSDVYGFDFRTDERAVKIADSRLLFENYNLYSTGKEPLVLNGVFDMSNFERMNMDFTMQARNFELINTRKKAQSMVFGKVYSNFLGSLKGTTDNLSIRGKLEVLDRTDMTYVLKDSPLSVDNRLNDLVQFVNFNDSTTHNRTKPVPEGSFDLTLGISVSDAARFHCNLSDDGQSYVDLEGGGDLTLRMTQQGEMRMTGRFTANSGEMKYALPVIPLKTFNLVQGSYVEFTGDVMNPTLNIAAKERTRAIVTENNRPRSVAFDVGVAITRPLSDMGLEFTIEAPEDLTVQNQLATMSAEQRGKAAVTMMATGMYMTDETMLSGSGFKANNALNAFLQSEIQNIAGSALKTIDINLGVESGTAATGTSTTDYSFQFAKRFWGNRISVIIGGKVSTGADAVNSAESFINNISVEYRLDQSATRYVKVFYDRDSQDPLEGQLTKTGAGLVLRRKTDRLGELFIFKKKKKDVPVR